MKLDHQSLIGLHAHSCTHTFCLFLSNLSYSYTRALLVSPNRHLFVTPCIQGRSPLNSYVILKHKKLALVTGTQIHSHPNIPQIPSADAHAEPDYEKLGTFVNGLAFGLVSISRKGAPSLRCRKRMMRCTFD
jgi:hypothetical protein